MTGDVGKLYAQALFELSLESESLENVCFELKQCREIFDENPQLVKLSYIWAFRNLPQHFSFILLGRPATKGN